MSDGQDPPLRTTLHERHVAAGAEMRADDGWLVPDHYGDAEAETGRVRSRAGVFDLSHVGRIRVRGDGALDLLDRLCTADVAHQEDDTAAYTLLCDEAGGIVDHALLVRLDRYWILTCSPHRRPAVLEHLQAHADEFGAKVDDQTLKTSMLALVGPGAAAILDAVLPEPASRLPRGAAKIGSMVLARYLAVRRGATRLWSIEVMLPNMLAGRAWDFITRRAGANAVAPAGLATRERLRIEARLPKCGRDFHVGDSPVDAKLLAAVDLGKDFLGAEAVRAAASEA